MKTKDLVYLGVVGVLAYLLLRKKPASKDLETTTSTSSNNTPVGNSTNGGLNLGSNMDLPNLTPTPADGLSTEVALSSSNVNPLIKEDNEPTQIFGGVTLPTPYMSTSVVNPNPVDVVPASASSTTSNPNASTTVDAPRPYRPTVNLPEYPSYGREPDVIMENTYNTRPSDTTPWVIPRPTAPYADIRLNTKGDYRDLM